MLGSLLLLTLLGSADFPLSIRAWDDTADAQGWIKSEVSTEGMPFPQPDAVALIHCVRRARLCTIVFLMRPGYWTRADWPMGDTHDLPVTSWSKSRIQAEADSTCFRWVVTFEALGTETAAVHIETMPLPKSRQGPARGVACTEPQVATRARLAGPPR